MPNRQWKTAEEINAMIEVALDLRWQAFENRMAPTLEALRDGAQSALYTNVLLVGDGRFVEKGFIQETRDRFDRLEIRQTKVEGDTTKMHKQNLRIHRRIYRRQSLMLRALKWLTVKDEKGERRWHRIAIAAGAAGSSLTVVVAHLPAWCVQAHKIIQAVKGVR